MTAGVVSDGSKLRESWSNALKSAQSRFRALLVSSTTAAWKPVSNKPRDSTSASARQQSSDTPISRSSSKGKGKSRTGLNAPPPELSDVVLHRKSSKDGDVLRAVLDITVDDTFPGLDAWKAVLTTPEMRKEYDPSVQDGRIIEMYDPGTRISKTDFVLGWPANPRDAITISKSFVDATTFIDICTSLPRSPDEPAYLRPAPPFVRSHIHLFAWCIQCIQPPTAESSNRPSLNKLRITCFWQHDLKALWGIGGSISQNLPAMLIGLVKTVRSQGNRMALVTGYGHGVGISHLDFEVGRQLLTLEYSISNEDEDTSAPSQPSLESLDDLHALKEQRRLERSIEYSLPSSHSWDVQVHTRTSSTTFDSPHWIVHASKPASLTDDSLNDEVATSHHPPIVFRISHPRPPEHSVLKVSVAIEPVGGTNTLRVNGSHQPIHVIEPRDPSSFTLSREMFQDASTISEISIGSTSSNVTSNSTSSVHARKMNGVAAGSGALSLGAGAAPPRTPAAQKAVLTLVRRNYIYFTSLLQEPEAKWSRPITEARGVTVTQLDSIDPTLVVYRAEAVFVGVGVWDLLSTITTPGVASFWNKGHEDAIFLEHVNQLTELWHMKTRAAWPVNARDSVQVKTTYKSPTACHIFSFSTDDTVLFPSIPPTELSTIRTQIDLQGWAIEALSPNTTLLTLLDQSDPKGWSNKSSIPSQMIAAVAGVGEFAIKRGGPPIATRVSGAKVVNSRYDHERNVFRLDYEPNLSPPSPVTLQLQVVPEAPSTTSLASTDDTTPLAATVDLPVIPDEETERSESPTLSTAPSSSVQPPSTIECELRCDIDTWAASLDVIVDPAPQTISCLRRHKLASEGGGLWITIEHDAGLVADERLNIVVRKGPGGKDRGSVVINGVKVKVDVEELPEHEVKSLSRKKRIKPTRIPLDQPPVLLVRRKQSGYEEEQGGQGSLFGGPTPSWMAPFNKFFTQTINQVTLSTVATAAVMSPAASSTSFPASPIPDSRPPMHHAFDALSRLQEIQSQPISDGWTLVSEKEISVFRKIIPGISPTIAVHKGQKVIEGFGAEEVASVITNSASRMEWDDRIDSVLPLEQYGAGCQTSFVVTKAGFPFRDRGFFTASVTARLQSNTTILLDDSGVPRSRSTSITSAGTAGHSASPTSRPSTIFCVSTSYTVTTPSTYSQPLVNPFTLPVGRILIEGWILETLDPYTAENFAIPSTRCTMIAAIDLAGSVPAGYNNSTNASLPRTILALEKYLRGKILNPYPLLPAPALLIHENDDAESPRADTDSQSWILKHADGERSLVTSNYSPEFQTFRLVVHVKPEGTSYEERLAVGTRPNTPQRRSTFVAESPPPSRRSHSRSLSRHASTISTPDRSQAPAAGSGIFFPRDSNRDDFIFCEVILDPALYPTGYNIQIASKILGAGDPIALKNGFELSPTPLDPTENSAIPIQSTIQSIPALPLASNSLSSPAKRQLLRITVPSSLYETPPLEDPLTGKTANPPVKPEWLLKLEQQGGIIDLVVKPANDKKSGILINGKKVSSPSDKNHLSALGQERLETERIDEWPLLKRGLSDNDCSPAMQHPIASSWHLFDSSVFAPVEDSGKVESAEATVEDLSTDPSPSDTPPGIETPNAEPATGLFGFLNSYTNPLNRRPSAGSLPVQTSPSYWTPGTSLTLPGRWLSRRSFEHKSDSVANDNTTQKGRDNSHATATAVVGAVAQPGLPLRFSVQAVLVIALISFLLGSLLRSLLSPADFLLLDNQSGSHGGEWKEMKRLLHFYVLGRGFIIAIVRR